MKKTIHLTGFIEKKEVLVPITTYILENTCVSEATNPYANYYGELPRKAKPNSIFLHTKKVYFLEEILSSLHKLDKCLLESINIAIALIEVDKKQFPAIRIKNFPDYKQLSKLQECMQKQGVEFRDKIALKGEVKMKINKLFSLEEAENDFYIDRIEENKGYFTHKLHLSGKAFDQVITQIKYNGNSKLFDAVRGEILMDGNVVELVRIYSEGLDLNLLQSTKRKFEQISYAMH